jgi:flagellar basal-body rod modification protein FlgD
MSSTSSIFGASPGSITASTSSSPTTYSPTTSNNEYGNAKPTAGQNNLTQADFLNLTVTQMQNQDPTNPISDSDMATQMAQFSTLQATTNMSTTMQNMSGLTQLSSSAALIGQTVTTDLVDSNNNPITGVVTSAGVQNGTLTLTVGGNHVGISDVTGITQTAASSSSGSSASGG